MKPIHARISAIVAFEAASVGSEACALGVAVAVVAVVAVDSGFEVVAA